MKSNTVACDCNRTILFQSDAEDLVNHDSEQTFLLRLTQRENRGDGSQSSSNAVAQRIQSS